MSLFSVNCTVAFIHQQAEDLLCSCGCSKPWGTENRRCPAQPFLFPGVHACEGGEAEARRVRLVWWVPNGYGEGWGEGSQ